MCKKGAIRGRGALSNDTGRYEATTREAFDDGWPRDEEPSRPATEFFSEATRSAITRNVSPDLPFDRSINPYRGCEHGCVYCFARPTHAYLGLSAGLDFETRITAKPDAPACLERELSKPGYECRLLALGTNTDPYQPGEKRYRITRRLLEILSEHRHPVGIVTKSALVLRDVDLLAPMAERRLATVMVSVTSLRASIARTLEPRAAAPHRRLEVVRRLAESGVPTGVMIAPVIPGLTDEELESIVSAAAEAGACRVEMVLLRLPLEVDALFREWMDTHEPGRAKKVYSLLDAMHGVERAHDGQPRGSRGGGGFGVRHRGRGTFAEALAWRLRRARERVGLTGRMPDLDTSQFRVPPERRQQLSMFDVDGPTD